MNYWHMQLHPGDSELSVQTIKSFLEAGVIGMGEAWENDRGAPARFSEEAAEGDVVLVRHDGPFALVRIESPVRPNNDDQLWFDIVRDVRVLSWDAEYYKKRFAQETGQTWNANLYLPATFENANKSPFVDYWHDRVLDRTVLDEVTELLRINKNLILSGAPGTGKTYLAKEIAREICGDQSERTERVRFVQFHPSYDYTDFVEGLRPYKEPSSSDIGFELKNGVFKQFCKAAAESSEDTPFVFIIDEINRGDLSKIFGELFFSVDPGYRGEAGKVMTQFANLQTKETCFTDPANDYFYVPTNVYIIGTMNDIDRSVEPFDFAMRRRFAWREITASERVGMWSGQIDEWKMKAKAVMSELNRAIENIEGLDQSYHVGPAYFLRLKDHEGSFKALWKHHLEGLIRQYLKGLPRSEQTLGEVRRTYFEAVEQFGNS